MVIVTTVNRCVKGSHKKGQENLPRKNVRLPIASKHDEQSLNKEKSPAARIISWPLLADCLLPSNGASRNRPPRAVTACHSQTSHQHRQSIKGKKRQRPI